MHIDTNQSRRTFLQRAAQLSATGAAASFVSTLGLLGEAAASAATVTDYRAMVCVFLFGGNDNANTLPPYDPANYNAYAAARPRLAISRANLAATALAPANNLGGRQFALHPSLKPLLPLFQQGKLAPLLNVGALIQPTSKAAFNANSVKLPPKLFSHNDQRSFMESFAPEGADAGWGGRMGDMLQSNNGTAALTCLSVHGRSLWLSGQSVVPYTVKPGTITELFWGQNSVVGSRPAYDTLLYLATRPQQNSWIAQEHGKVLDRAVKLSQTVSSALNNAPDSQFTTFTSSGNDLADQLKMVARLIAVGPSLGLKRQVFLVSMGGYDTHSNMLGRHDSLLADLGTALSQFYAATVKLGVQDKVTTFTQSDFGRTLADNGDGSDHGWGGTQFVLGGAVKGGRIYGTPPAIGIDTNDDVGSGRLIPTTSVDQMAATLGAWFGLSSAELRMVLPNIGNFNPSSWNLGFV